MTIDEQMAQVASGQGATPVQPEQAPATPDWSKTTIPDDVIRNHPAYKDILSESIGRRQEIAALKQELESAKKPAATTPEAPVQPVAPGDERIDKLMAAVEALTARQAQSDKARIDQYRAGLIAQYNIPPAQQALITAQDETGIKAQVDALAPLLSPHKSDMGLGNTGDAPATDSLVKEVKSILNGNATIDPFDPKIHKAMGGDL